MEEHNKLFENLNDKQIEAVMATEGKVRVIAGAGSGKTRVLVHRFAYLVNEIGISPSNILCMTFTNKAAQEMRNRIAKMVHTGHVNDFVCTIHGFCVKVLRRDIYRMGYPKNFVIQDDEDAKIFAKQAMEEFGMDYTQKTINKFLHEDVLGYKFSLLEPPLSTYIEKIVLPTAKRTDVGQIDVVERYIQLQINNFALDFSDIVLFALWLLNNYKDVREYWQEKLNYVMVDEVQDCNMTDWSIIKTITEKYNNLFIVGDPDQAIYEWRGAKPKLFIDFKPDIDIILNENYRSTPNILDVANSIITNNKERVKKELFTQKKFSQNAIHYHGKNEEDETSWIANRIYEMNINGIGFNQIAILYRASYLSRNIEQALIQKQIKYTVWGGVRFFERKEIKDSLAYLRLVSNKDDLSFQRIVNVPSRKFGGKSMKLLKDYSEQEGTNLYQTLLNHKDDNIFNKEPILAFIELIEECTKKQSEVTITELFDFLLKGSGLWDMYRVEGDEDRIDNINEFINSIRLYESVEREEDMTLETYLQDIALFTNADYKDDGETVKLMTIHQAKGLEFPFVFICGLSEGIFPNHRTIREQKSKGEEEERRLMYVAVTRAEKALFLTESAGFNSALRDEKYPSRFLYEIKDELLEIQGNITREALKVLLKISEMVVDKLNNEINPKEFSVGNWVVHKVFGKGEIIEKTIGNSYKVHFDIGDRYILSNLLVLSESPRNDFHNENVEEIIEERPRITQESNDFDVIEIMKKARSGSRDAILYCAQHKIDPFNFEDNFFYEYESVRIGDWFYDDGSFSRSRSDLKKCVGVVFSLNTSQLEQADGWTHGLIVAIRDAGQGSWGPYEDLAYPHTHYSTKDLEVLEKSPDSFNDYHTEFLLRDSINNAFKMAREIELNLPKGKTSGWYLPSITQLRQIACNLPPETLSIISMNSGELYWSSSQSNANEACYIYISKGNNTFFSFDTDDKDCPFRRIRPILAF